VSTVFIAAMGESRQNLGKKARVNGGAIRHPVGVSKVRG